MFALMQILPHLAPVWVDECHHILLERSDSFLHQLHNLEISCLKYHLELLGPQEGHCALKTLSHYLASKSAQFPILKCPYSHSCVPGGVLLGRNLLQTSSGQIG